MDGLSLLLSLLALLKQFLDSPTNRDMQAFEAFLEFLLDRNHRQVVQGLEANELLSLKVQALLMESFNTINSVFGKGSR